MWRKAFMLLHSGLAMLCLAGLFYSAATGSHRDSPAFAFEGFFLFGAMALAIVDRSRRVLLPGCLLIRLSLILTVVLAAAFV